MTLLVTSLLGSTAIDVDVKDDTIYWSDNELRAIRRINLVTMKVDDLITQGLGEVAGIAVEWESGLLYWTDFIHERIEVAKLDGSHRKTLIWKDLDNPRAIVVDPRNG